MQELSRNLAHDHHHVGEAVRRRFEVLNDVEKFAGPAVDQCLVALRKLIGWQEFVNQ